MNVEKIKAAVRNVPDFPKPGIIYKDITPLLQDGAIFSELINFFYFSIVIPFRVCI